MLFLGSFFYIVILIINYTSEREGLRKTIKKTDSTYPGTIYNMPLLLSYINHI
jgi:hypothetical protein